MLGSSALGLLMRPHVGLFSADCECSLGRTSQMLHTPRMAGKVVDGVWNLESLYGGIKGLRYLSALGSAPSSKAQGVGLHVNALYTV